tara:strand:- start:417 stop:2048 length:1632 start_codon:yes stop_codon:yes gene_type:complete
MGVLVASAAGQDPSSEEILAPSIFPVGYNWQTTLPTAPTGLPASDETFLYIPLRNDQFVAVSRFDGIVQWAVEQQVDFRPTPSGDTVFVVNDKKVRALWAVSGAEKWNIDLPEPASTEVYSNPDWLIIGLVNGLVSAHARSTGRPIWTQELSAAVRLPTVDDNHLYVPQDNGAIAALELSNGAVLWERQLGGAPGPITVAYDQLYVGTTDNFLYAIDQSDGRIRWRWRTGGDIVGAPVVDSETIYFVSLDNQLRALARKSGVQLWKQDLPTRPVGGLVQFGDALMISGRTLPLHLIYSQTGEAAGDFSSAPMLTPLQPGETDLLLAEESEESASTAENAEETESEDSDELNAVELGEALEISTELAAPPIILQAEGASKAEFVLLTGAGELHSYISAKALPLTPQPYIPGMHSTSSLTEANHEVPEWLIEPLRNGTVDLTNLPGMFEITQDFEFLDHPPGLRFTPPLTTGLAALPGRGGPAERQLAPFNLLPGIQMSVEDLTRGLEIYWDSGWIVVGSVNDEVLLTPLTKMPGQLLGVPNKSS